MNTSGKGGQEKGSVTVNTGNVPKSRLAMEMIPGACLRGRVS